MPESVSTVAMEKAEALLYYGHYKDKGQISDKIQNQYKLQSAITYIFI